MAVLETTLPTRAAARTPRPRVIISLMLTADRILELLLLLLATLRPQLRQATEDDAGALQTLLSSCSGDLLEETRPVEWWLKRLADEHYSYGLLERAGRCIGCVGVTSTREATYDLPMRGHVTLLAVHHAWRRRGYGTFMLQNAIDSLEPLHDCVSLFVRPANQAALRLYERFGFREWRRVHSYYRDGGEGLLCVRWRDEKT